MSFDDCERCNCSVLGVMVSDPEEMYDYSNEVKSKKQGKDTMARLYKDTPKIEEFC